LIHDRYFIKRQCTAENLHPAILYFPYVIFGIATLLFMVDRPFVLVIFSSLNMEKLHRLVVEEDPAGREREAQNLLQIRAASHNFFLSYLLRTLASLLASAAPLLLLAYVSTEFESGPLYCQVPGLPLARLINLCLGQK
jgi:hypothetical protein